MKGEVWQGLMRATRKAVSLPSGLVSPNGVRRTGKCSRLRNYQRYSALAREASSRDDMVAMENFYQHAEHYLKVMRAAHEGDE